MQKLTLPSGEYLLVEVPEDAKYIRLSLTTNSLFFYRESYPNNIGAHLPSGNWQLIGKASELGKEEWKGILKPIENWSKELYHNYTASGRDFRDVIDSAFEATIDSGLSLIRSHSMNPETTIILKAI